MYKIKFLSEIDITTKKGEAINKYHTCVYDHNEIPGIALNWKSMGFVRIEDVEILENKAKIEKPFTKAQIIEMFYADKDIDDADKAIKKALLDTYGKQSPKPSDTPEPEMSKEEKKEYRRGLFNQLKDKVKVPVNTPTEKLEELVNNLKS